MNIERNFFPGDHIYIFRGTILRYSICSSTSITTTTVVTKLDDKIETIYTQVSTCCYTICYVTVPSTEDSSYVLTDFLELQRISD